MEQRKLKEILKQKGISAYRLAIDCNIATSDMYMSLNGRKPMFPKWRKEIASYLKMDEAELFEIEERKV